MSVLRKRVSKKGIKSPIQNPAVSPESIWGMLEAMAERLMNERISAYEMKLERRSTQMEQEFDRAETSLHDAVVEIKRIADFEVTRHIQNRSIEIKGPKGDKGETGPMGAQGPAGRDGKDGRDGISLVGPKGEDGKDGSPDTGEAIVAKINTASTKIKPEQIDGLKEAVANIARTRRISGGGDVVEAGTNVTITRTADGKRRISSTGGGPGTTMYVETPVGNIDGVNTTYTVDETITTILNFSIEGQFIHPEDYSFAGSTVTFDTALDASLSGARFTIVYV